jgi:hypothetical protein
MPSFLLNVYFACEGTTKITIYQINAKQIEVEPKHNNASYLFGKGFDRGSVMKKLKGLIPIVSGFSNDTFEE